MSEFDPSSCRHPFEHREFQPNGLYCFRCNEYIDRAWGARWIGFITDAPSRLDWLIVLALLAALVRWG